VKHKVITDNLASRLKAPKAGQVDHFDGSYPNLVLRVSSGGRKTWALFYRHHGKLRRLKLGVYPAMSVKAAHEAWRAAQDELAAGKDPGADPAEGTAVDVASVIDEWLRRDQAKRRSYVSTVAAMKRYVVSAWDHRDVRDIGRRDCLNVLDKIVDAGHVTQALRMHQHLHRFFRWCVGRGIIDKNVMTDLPKPGEEVHRDRVLSDDELVKVWQQLDKLGDYGIACKLLILTGCRRNEIAKLRWSEIDGASIVLEGARTKTSKARTIQLSAPARAILDSIPRSGEFVFRNHGLTDWSHAKARLDEIVGTIEPWRIHDLRRTAATGLQKLGVSLQVTESVLGHTSGSRAGVIGIYQRHDYKDEMHAALDAWGARVMSLVSGERTARVVAFGGR
jgi:integrase